MASASRTATGVLNTRMAPRRRLRRPGNGVLQVALGFGVVLAIGTGLLLLPLATESGETAGVRTALFTATSAICVTGLVLYDTQVHWSTWGEVAILALIQVGGLGYMLGTTVVLWALGRQLGIRDRHMLRLYYGAPSMKETLSFARGVAIFTFAFEAAGAVILTLGFLGEGVPLSEAWWWGVFHSVSAFNNAGFSITGGDIVPYTGNEVILITITLLVIIGGLGFIPVMALLQRRSWRRLPVDSKLIILTSGALLLAGTLFVSAVEWRNADTFGDRPASERALLGFFHSANARTSGFTTVNIGAMNDESKVATIGLMFVGGAAGSTAGGLKVGAFALLFAVMLATLRGQVEVSVFRRQVPTGVIQQATTLALFYVALVFGFSMALTFTSEQAFIDVVFEVASALGTVGYTAAGTLQFGSAGHWVLILAMLFGRFSPLLLVLYMSQPRKRTPYHHPTDSVRLS